MFAGTFLPAFIVTTIPSLTLLHEPHPLLNTCLLDHDLNATQDYAYLLAFFIIIGNSLLVDVICFSRIFNYMRKNSVRVAVIAGKSRVIIEDIFNLVPSLKKLNQIPVPQLFKLK